MLTTGARIGSYEIVAPIGSGGMGEVYRARDRKLDRDVAIKILPDSLAADSDRIARFEREAKMLAVLNHPHIAQIYGLEGREGQDGREARAFIVMELVEGPTLADRIAQRPIPVDEALAIAKQIAEALEAAHEQGIIHRDLKPANIKLRADDTVKVLDFGLAKAMEPAARQAGTATMSPTLSIHATEAGIILGTAAYMAPEQARGKIVDRRADIWAFGCVLYEMLTGKRAFDGDDVSMMLAAVIMKEPDWSALPASLPATVATYLRRCLEKDPKQRIRDIGDVRLALSGAFDSASQPSATRTVAGGASRRRLALVAAIGLAIGGAAALASVAAWSSLRATSPPVTRFSVLPPEKTTFATGGRNATTVAISPDGSKLAFTARDTAGKSLIWIRAIDGLSAQPLIGTDDAVFPFWSPDSRFIGYMMQNKLMKIAAAGGPVQTLCETSVVAARGGAWSRDGTIVFSAGPSRPLGRVSAAGGQVTSFLQLINGQTGYVFPSFLPDGRHVLFYAYSAVDQLSGIFVASVVTGETKRLIGADSGAIYDSSSGRLLFVRQGTLMAQPFNLRTLTLIDEPVPIAEHVESFGALGVSAFSVSNTGVLAYGTGSVTAGGLQMMWVNRQGQPVQGVGPAANYRGLDLSPDGTRVIAHRHDGQGGDLWLTDMSRGTTSRFTLDATQENSSPVWSPDGTKIAFASVRNGKWGMFVKSSNGAGAEERVELESDLMLLPQSWSPDGQRLVYQRPNSTGGNDLLMITMTGGQKPTPLVQKPFSNRYAQVSPDGRWLAYTSNETGNTEVYVQPFPQGAGRWQVSTSGGWFPRWRHDARELFYTTQVSGGKMMAVDVKSNGSTFEAGTPKDLFESRYINLSHTSSSHTYAVSPDGQRFLVPVPGAGDSNVTMPIVVVENWAAALKK